MNGAPEYNALSYCWGDMRLCTGVFFTNLNGSENVYRVTEDLATCLHSILESQSLQRPTFLWVDQICINQDNTLERNSQVACMANIYKNASQVLVWLGQESDFDTKNNVLPAHPGQETGVDKQTILKWVLESAVFTRPWFNRLWVVQEVVLAKDITVLIGRDARPWRSIVEQALDTVDAAKASPVLFAFIEKIDLLVVEIVSGCRQEIAKTGHIDIERRLPQIAIYQHCRDSRDTVFGLLGCTGDVFPAAFADYRQPATKVFRDAARIIIDKYKSLHLLNFYSYQAFEDPSSPRWFPQWHLSLVFGLGDVWVVESKFVASRGRMHIPSPPNDPDDLDVRGKAVDTVATVVKKIPFSMSAFLENPATLVNFREICRQSWPHVNHYYAQTEECGPLYEVGSGQMLPIRFIQDVIDTMFCHDDKETTPVGPSTTSADDVYYNIFASFSAVEEEGSMDRGNSEKINLNAIVPYGPDMMQRNLVILQSGRFALVRAAVGEGDVIAILHGLSVPCVLRKVERTEKWHFIGDTFVKGLMRGEGVYWEEDEADTFTLI